MGRPAKGKTNSITIRIESKLRYGLELLARKQRRTLSSVIECAVARSIIEGGINLSELWDVDEADRLHKLLELQPDLLTYDEQVILKPKKVYKKENMKWNY